jgi:hypothetical protein
MYLDGRLNNPVFTQTTTEQVPPMKPEQVVVPTSSSSSTETPGGGVAPAASPQVGTAGPIPANHRESDRGYAGDGRMFPESEIGQPRPAVTAFTAAVPKAVGSQPDPPQMHSTAPAQQGKIAIPEGEPADVAATLAATRVPTSDAITLRVQQIDRDLLTAVDDARMYPAETRHTLRNFATFIGQMLTERARLLLKAGQPPGNSVAEEATKLVMSVARWSDGEEIRVHRVRHAGYLFKEHTEAERTLQSIMHPGHSYENPIVQEASVKARAAKLLAHRDQLLVRLTRLDGGGSARVAILGPALSAAGGAKAAATKLAPLLADTSAPGRTVSLRDDIASVTSQLSLVDPQTLRAAGLREHLARLETEQRGNAAADIGARRKRAESMLSDCAMSGNLDQLQQLAPVATAVSAAFATAVNLARGGPAEMTATIGEIITAHQLAQQDVADKKKALTFATGID